MKGIKKFARQMFGVSLKESFSYILTVIVTAMLVFITINLAFNEVIYQSTDMITLVTSTGGIAPQRIEYEVTVSSIQMQLSLITVIIVGVFTVITNNTYVKRRVKELAFVVTNGATMGEMSYYIRYMCSKIFVTASIIGILLGIALAPVFNFIMYKILGVQGDLVVYNFEVFMIIGTFLFMNYVYLMITSTSYVYKKEVADLLSDGQTKSLKDTRQFKFPGIVYVIIYFVPLIILLLPKSFGDISGFISVAVYISAIASIGVITMYLPSKLIKLNNSKFMNNKERKIYVNNAIMKLKNTVIYTVGMVFAINYFLEQIVSFRESQVLVSVVFFNLIICSIIIAVTLTNKIIDDCGIDKKFYNTLWAMGYSKQELFKISLKENRMTVGSILFFIIVPILYALPMQVINGTIDIGIALSILGVVLGIILFGGFISYEINKGDLYEILEMETNKILIMKKLTNKAAFVAAKALLFIFNFKDSIKNLWGRSIIWKFRVSHVAYLLIFVFLISPMLMIGFISSNFKKITHIDSLAQKPATYKMQGLLNLYVNMPKLSGGDASAYYYMGVNEYNYLTDYIYYSGEKGFGDISTIFKSEGGIEDAIKNHEKGLEKSKKNSEFYVKNSLALISLYYNNNQVDKAFTVIEDLKKSSDKKIMNYGFLSEGLLNSKLGNFDKALIDLEKIDSAIMEGKNMYIADVYNMKGDFTKANEELAKDDIYKEYLRPGGEDNKNREYSLRDVDVPYVRPINLNPYPTVIESWVDTESLKKSREAANKNMKENYTKFTLSEFRGNVNGKFIVDNKAMRGAAIVLTKDKLTHSQINGLNYKDGRESYISYVNDEGSFKFENIIEGNYYVNLIIPKNKFTQLEITESFIENEVIKVEKDKSVNVSFEKNKDGKGLVLVSDNTKNLVSGTTLKGNYKSEGNKVIFEVGKGDKMLPAPIANKMLISKDTKVLEFYKELAIDYPVDMISTFYKLGEKITTEGSVVETSIFGSVLEKDEVKVKREEKIEIYILGAKYQELITELEKIYKEDSSNEDVITMLIKLYTLGTDNGGLNKDINRALELSDKLYEVTKSESLDWQVKNFIYSNMHNIYKIETGYNYMQGY